MISRDCEIEMAVNLSQCFLIKRLIRDCGTSSDSAMGTLSIALNVIAEDMFSRLTNPHCYRLDIIKSLFSMRDDLNVFL